MCELPDMKNYLLLKHTSLPFTTLVLPAIAKNFGLTQSWHLRGSLLAQYRSVTSLNYRFSQGKAYPTFDPYLEKMAKGNGDSLKDCDWKGYKRCLFMHTNNLLIFFSSSCQVCSNSHLSQRQRDRRSWRLFVVLVQSILFGLIQCCIIMWELRVYSF